MTVKLLLNSVIYTPKARFCTMDISNFYLGTTMDRNEYMMIPVNLFTSSFSTQYNINKLQNNHKMYINIQKGMYGLPQSGLLANQQLQKALQRYVYYPCMHTIGLWKHKWRPITFTLVVDDFGIKYEGKEHDENLLQCLNKHYEKITVYWTGNLYCGIHLTWNYEQQWVDLQMTDYISNMLQRFKNLIPMKQQFYPHHWKPPVYGASTQFPLPNDFTEKLPPKSVTIIQKIIGTILYYARIIYHTMLVALSTISRQHTKATINTWTHLKQLLDYCATHPNDTIRYKESNMVLQIHSDASYLSEPKDLR